MASSAPVCRVAVLGLSGEGDFEGVGKSSLCARFVRPCMDDYLRDGEDHNSTVSNSDFQEPELNGDHFLYFGRTQRREGLPAWRQETPWAAQDGSASAATIRFEIVEQTELIDDSTYAPFRYNKSYVQRATADKLPKSTTKVSYISRSSIGAPETPDRPRTPFPTEFHKHGIDAFLFVLDPTASNVRRRRQLDLLEECLKKLPKKKPVVVFVSKCDAVPSLQAKADKAFDVISFFGGSASTMGRDQGKSAGRSSMRFSKPLQQMVCFLGSARCGIGVDEPFLYLAHKAVSAPSSPPHPQSYAIMVQVQAQAKSESLEGVKALMRSQVMSYMRSWVEVEKRLKDERNTDLSWMTYLALCGVGQCCILFRMRLVELKLASSRAAIEKAAVRALRAMPPDSLSMPSVSLIHSEEFMRTLCDHPDLLLYTRQPQKFTKALEMYGITLPIPDLTSLHQDDPTTSHDSASNEEALAENDNETGWGEEEWDDGFMATQDLPLPPPPDELLNDMSLPDEPIEGEDGGGVYEEVVDISPMPTKPKTIKPPLIMPRNTYTDDLPLPPPPGHPRAHGVAARSPSQKSSKDNLAISNSGDGYSSVSARSAQQGTFARGAVYDEIGAGTEDPSPTYDRVSLGSPDNEHSHSGDANEEENDLAYEDVSEQDFNKPPPTDSRTTGFEYETVKPHRNIPLPEAEGTASGDTSDGSYPAMATVQVSSPVDEAAANDGDARLYETVKPQRKITPKKNDDKYETIRPHTTTVGSGPGIKRSASTDFPTEKGTGKHLSDSAESRARSNTMSAFSEDPTYMYSSVNVSDIKGAPQRQLANVPATKVRPMHLLSSGHGSKSYNRPPGVGAMTPSSPSTPRRHVDKQGSIEDDEDTEPLVGGAASYAIIKKPANKKGRVPSPASVDDASPYAQPENEIPRLPPRFPQVSQEVTSSAPARRSTVSGETNAQMPSPEQLSRLTKKSSTLPNQPGARQSPGNVGRATPPKPTKPARKTGLLQRSSSSKDSPPAVKKKEPIATPHEEKEKGVGQRPWWETPPSSPATAHQGKSANTPSPLAARASIPVTIPSPKLSKRSKSPRQSRQAKPRSSPPKEPPPPPSSHKPLSSATDCSYETIPDNLQPPPRLHSRLPSNESEQPKPPVPHTNNPARDMPYDFALRAPVDNSRPQVLTPVDSHIGNAAESHNVLPNNAQARSSYEVVALRQLASDGRVVNVTDDTGQPSSQPSNSLVPVPQPRTASIGQVAKPQFRRRAVSKTAFRPAPEQESDP